MLPSSEHDAEQLKSATTCGRRKADFVGEMVAVEAMEHGIPNRKSVNGFQNADGEDGEGSGLEHVWTCAKS